MMIETTTVYNLMSVWMTLNFIQITAVYSVHFCANVNIDLDEVQYVATSS